MPKSIILAKRLRATSGKLSGVNDLRGCSGCLERRLERIWVDSKRNEERGMRMVPRENDPMLGI